MMRLREQQGSLKFSGLGPFTRTHKKLCLGNENFGKFSPNLSGVGWSATSGNER